MKILHISNVGNRFNSFALSSSIAAKELGIEFHTACNAPVYNDIKIKKEDEEEYGIKIHQIDFVRTPYNLKNLKAYHQVIELIEKEGIDIIHCNTPIGGVIGRLAGRKCGVDSIIYQAHGFHFYKGAPLINWLLYYPIERWLAHYTDVLVTINKEDYQRALDFKLRNNGKVYYVPGVGIDTSRYNSRYKVREEKRKELNLSNSEIMILSFDTTEKSNNYVASIRAIAKCKNKRIQYYICGEGSQNDVLENLAKELGVGQQVHFLDAQTDVGELLQAADIFLILTPKKDLSCSLIEAMANGLPCIVSNTMENAVFLNNGCCFFVNPMDSNRIAELLDQLSENDGLRCSMGLESMNSIYRFSLDSAKSGRQNDYKREIEMTINQYLPKWAKKRFELNIPLDTTLLISIGELNNNKNNAVIIEALKDIPNVHYILCGDGPLKEELEKRSENIHDRVHYLGYRTDINDLLLAADIFVMPSFREGLSRSLMEAMACGLPCVVSNIRGNVDLISEECCLCRPTETADFVYALKKLINDRKKRNSLSSINMKRIKEYSLLKVTSCMKEIYSSIL